MTKLQLTRSVLDRDESTDRELNIGLTADSDFPTLVSFVQRDEETNEIHRVVGLDLQSYRDMGGPEQITITVEAGAKLEAKA